MKKLNKERLVDYDKSEKIFQFLKDLGIMDVGSLSEITISLYDRNSIYENCKKIRYKLYSDMSDPLMSWREIK